MLVIVDDHTRFVSVYFMQTKAEAGRKVQQFVASFNAYASLGKTQPVRIVGSLKSDNAGEFLSRNFQEFLDAETISQSTCPPHVHSLNGVAERTIRSIMEQVRSNLVASNSPISFWNFAADHAVDVLNRTTGAPGQDASSFELLTGTKPKIMPILPYGCRSYSVKPRVAYSKTNMDSRSWVGINLGRCPNMPGAYRTWLPQHSKIVTSSEVYFEESLFPWRGDHDGSAVAVPSPAPEPDPLQVNGIPPAGFPAPNESAPSSSATSISSAWAAATRRGATTARDSKLVLILFSGPYKRPDSLAAYLKQQGLDVLMIDNDAKHGGATDDISNDAFFQNLLSRVKAGHFLAVFAAPPCSTFSVSRLFDAPDEPDGGPPPVRDRDEPDGLTNVPAEHAAELASANKIISRTTAILSAAFDAGTQFVLEHPADRGDRSLEHIFLDPNHAPLWLTSDAKRLKEHSHASYATFAQCMYGAQHQKYTTLMYTAGFDSHFAHLDSLRCNHKDHPSQVGGHRGPDGKWKSAGSAAYPAGMNLMLAKAISALAFGDLPASPSEASPRLGDEHNDHIAKNAERETALLKSLMRKPKAFDPPPVVAQPASLGNHRCHSMVLDLGDFR